VPYCPIGLGQSSELRMNGLMPRYEIMVLKPLPEQRHLHAAIIDNS